MSLHDFQPWPKIPRLHRHVVITEKIDGTNGAVVVTDEEPDEWSCVSDNFVWFPVYDDTQMGAPVRWVAAQSRKRFITPADDNFGFAAWVRDNAHTLGWDLGTGRHFGEWYGRGIQRTYGLEDRRFALFNTLRWHSGPEGPMVTNPERQNRPGDEPKYTEPAPSCCEVVPVLYHGVFDYGVLIEEMDKVREVGSLLPGAEGFSAEGLVVYHKHANQPFKVLLDNDDISKTEASRR